MKFRQLESGTPADIEATGTSGELEQLKEGLSEWEESQTVNNLSAAITAGNDKFIISGDEAAEVGDYNEDLELFLEELNNKTIELAESGEIE